MTDLPAPVRSFASSPLGRFINLFKGRDKGTVAVTFLLSLPIFFLVVAIIVQYALLANARLTLDRAIASAARAAMTSLPTNPATEDIDGPGNVKKAACLILTPISPVAPNSGSTDSQALADALGQLGISVSPGFANRYAFADIATTITIQRIDQNNNPIDSPVSINVYHPPNSSPPPSGATSGLSGLPLSKAAGARVRITISYPFRLTVPAARDLIGGSGPVAGVPGRFFTLTAVRDVQLSDGREVPINAMGEP
jgi:Flp pilus assembly protein TadG